MINAETELKNKCYKYFPDEKTTMVTGNYKIKMPSTPSEHGAYSVSVFKIFTTKKATWGLRNYIKDVEVSLNKLLFLWILFINNFLL